ncbi:MAG: hypothetical protein WC869_08540 [Phycisphaerae bacterium]|jgi:hypothetical protein
MQKCLTLTAFMCLVLLACPLWAQEATAPAKAPATVPAGPPLEPVMQYFPSDALGFAVVSNVVAMTGGVDKYLADVGLAPLLADKMPNGLLDTIKQAAMLGEGFNPNGGFAFVMLDPNKFGVDLVAMMDSQESEATTEPATAAEKPKLPFAVFVPGKSVKEVFGNYEQTPAGKYTEVALRVGKVQATQMGGYVVLSPTAAVLDALAAEAGAASAQMPADQKTLIDNSALAIHLNMNVAMPIVESLMKKAEAEMASAQARGGQQNPAILQAYMDMYKGLLSQMTGLTLAARFAETGVVLETLADFKADSTIGKDLAAFKPVAPPTFSRVMDKGYVLAFAGAGNPTQTHRDMVTEMMDKFMGGALQLDEATQASFKELALTMNEQIVDVQFVAGGVPSTPSTTSATVATQPAEEKGSGVFGLSYVLTCKDSAKVRSMLGEKYPDLVMTMIKAAQSKKPVAAEDPNEAATTEPAESQPAEAFKLNYLKEVEKVGDIPVDVVEINVADIEGARETIGKLLGEEKLRVFIAAIDDKTVVVTFGGSLPYLEEAIKTAKAGNGTILSTPGAVEVMKHMPKNLCGIGLFNVGNLVTLISKGMQATGAGAGIPFQMTASTPVALGVATSGSSVHMVLYVPNDLVKDIAGIISGFLAPMRQGAPSSAPAQSGEQNF